MITNSVQYNTSIAYGGMLLPYPKIPDRVTVYQSDHDWSVKVRDKLDELCALEEGWDGYNALPVSFTTSAFALSLLEEIGNNHTPTPQIVPGVDGDLQIEWRMEKGEIELHVRSPYDVIAWRSTEETPDDGEEVILKTDFKIIAEWLTQVAE